MPQPPAHTAITGTNYLRFDPWHSSSTGHQVSDTTPRVAWRRTREAKLAHQLRTGDCAVSSSSIPSFPDSKAKRGEWVWSSNAMGSSSGLGGPDADPQQRDIRSMMRVQKGSNATSRENGRHQSKCGLASLDLVSTMVPKEMKVEDNREVHQRKASEEEDDEEGMGRAKEKGNGRKGPGLESTILRGATIYINGQTAPLVSDHKLKGLLVVHGATLALGLSRRVTHVIIGKPNQGPGRGGAGGGLAAGKIQKEIQRGGWRGIKVVGVEWVLECVKAGKRLPETRFAINLSNQKSVLAFM